MLQPQSCSCAVAPRCRKWSLERGSFDSTSWGVPGLGWSPAPGGVLTSPPGTVRSERGRARGSESGCQVNAGRCSHGEEKRAVPGLSQGCLRAAAPGGREQLGTDSAQPLGPCALEASQPRTQAPDSGLTRPGVESAALADCRAHRDPHEDTQGSGSPRAPIPEPQNGDDFMASHIRTLSQ